MSNTSDELFNLHSINKIINNDGTINLTDLETLTSLSNFISSHSSHNSRQYSSLKLSDDDLLELINVHKNKNDTRNFLDKLDIMNDNNTCSNNIELIVDTSSDVVRDIPSDVVSDIPSDVVSDIPSDVVRDTSIEVVRDTSKTRRRTKRKALSKLSGKSARKSKRKSKRNTDKL